MPSSIMEDDFTNFRPILIFIFYLFLCALLTVLILRTLHFKYTHWPFSSRPNYFILIFFVLALLSLASTWTFMFAFFSYSYRFWSFEHGASLARGADMELGLWLRDTQLFKEAWESVVETPARFWWSQQIFFFAAGWAVFLGREGSRRSIPHIWAFMLLGQVVAISFAMNLSFLTILLSPTHRNTTNWTAPFVLQALPIVVTLIAVAWVPVSRDSTNFMMILMLPHIALLFPPLLPKIIPRSWGHTHHSPEPANYYARILYTIILLSSVIFEALATLGAIREKGSFLAVLRTLWEHPAVSSVGWDVILCWISIAIWLITEGWGRGKRVVSEVGKEE